MDKWDKFFASGKILDYIDYAKMKRGGKNADAEMPDTKREKHG